MVNILSNYGLLDRNNIDNSQFKKALRCIGVDSTIINLVIYFLIPKYAFKNNITPSLKSLGQHGIVEHDASLTREDYILGDSIKFNNTRYKKMKSFSKNKTHLTLDEMILY